MKLEMLKWFRTVLLSVGAAMFAGGLISINSVAVNAFPIVGMVVGLIMLTSTFWLTVAIVVETNRE